MDRVLFRLYAATFFFALCISTALPLVPQALRLDFGASLAFVGVVTAMNGVMQIALRLPLGDMADRRGRKRSLYIAFASVFLAGAFFALAPSRWWFLPGQAAFGFATGLFWVAANSYLFDRVGKGDVPKATSDYAFASGAGFFLAPLLGGFVADRAGFAVAFSILLVAGVLGLALVATLPEAPVARAPPAPGGVYRRAGRLLRGSRALVVSAVGTFLYSVQFNAVGTFLPLHVRALALSATFVGVLLGARQLSATAVRVGLPWAIRRWGAAGVLLAGVAVASALTAAIPFARSEFSLMALALAVGGATGIMIPANLTLVHEGAPPGERGLANGIYGTMLGVGVVTSFPLGWVGSTFGLAWSFWGAAALSIAGLVALVASLRRARAPVTG